MKYSSQYKQLTIDLFSDTLENILDSSNRWYRLAKNQPWDKIGKIYNSALDNKHHGAGNKPARMIVGALIIKHQMSLSDVETTELIREIELIRENPYTQYFVGLNAFSEP
jgi:hypothetical protein